MNTAISPKLFQLNIKNEILSSFFGFMILFFIFYSPRFFGIDFGSLFCVIFGAIGFFVRLQKKEKLFWGEVYLGYLFIYSLILFLFFGLGRIQDSTYYFLRITRGLSFYSTLYILYYSLNLNTKDIIRVFLAVLGIHFILVFLQYFPPLELRLFFLKLNPIFDPSINMNEFNLTMVGGKRVKGAMMGFDGAGIIIAYVASLSFIFIKQSWQKIVMLLLCAVGVMITSRTGSVLLIIFSAFYYLNQFIFKRKLFWKELIIVLTIFIIGITAVMKLRPESTFVKMTIPNSFEFVYNFIDTGSMKVASMNDTLTNHWMMSKDDYSFIGYPKRQAASPDGIIHSASQSDVGYLQILANFGIPNLVLIVLVHLYLMYSIWKRQKTIFDIRLILLFMFLVACIKGPYFFGRMIYDVILVILFLEQINKSQKEAEFIL